ADAELYAQQQNAEAILAERTANSKAIAKRNEALRGGGGKAMVKLKIAEALEGKTIVLVPGGAPGSAFNKMDVNKLIDTFKDQDPEKGRGRARVDPAPNRGASRARRYFRSSTSRSARRALRRASFIFARAANCRSVTFSPLTW